MIPNFNVEQAQEEVNWLGSIYGGLKEGLCPAVLYDPNYRNDGRLQWILDMERLIHDRLREYYVAGVMPDNVNLMWLM